MRIAPVITLSPEQRTVLESQVRSRSLPLRVVERWIELTSKHLPMNSISLRPCG